ncbi:MAG: hypothetical protein J0I06_14775 [Planctomycetes bacterium]|nr:hypothetical protein [Planctomycetota bacterium]
MTPKQIEQWAKTRQMGRTRFIWLRGVCGWGLTVGIAWAVVMAAVQGWDRLPILLALAVVGFPIGGYFFGVFTWRACEKRYEEATRDDDWDV